MYIGQLRFLDPIDEYVWHDKCGGEWKNDRQSDSASKSEWYLPTQIITYTIHQQNEII